MIHIGAMMGWNISQMKYKAFPRLSKLFKKFQNDRDKRDFVASGAAAGNHNTTFLLTKMQVLQLLSVLHLEEFCFLLKRLLLIGLII